MSTKVAIIPARSGSKGLPNKNILMLLRKPLIAYTIEAAIESGVFDQVIVSTDSMEYKHIAEQYGAEVIIRDKALASDTASSFMVVEDVLSKMPECTSFALLQPTSPFRTSKHIKEAMTLFEGRPDAHFLASVAKSGKSAELIKPIGADLTLKHFEADFSRYRRQNHDEFYPNGAIFIGYCQQYLAKKHFFGKNSIAYLMSKADSIDIDDKLDFELAITLQSQKEKANQLLLAIEQRIEDKLAQPVPATPITLIGHSIFDYWDIKEMGGHAVNNFGIAGISSKQYLDLILKNHKLSSIGNNVLLFAGTNDMVIDGWTEIDTINWVNEIVQEINKINPKTKVHLIAVPPVRGRLDRSNHLIQQLNSALKQHAKGVEWVELSEHFYDPFGNLPANYTTDGLHFSAAAYQQLEADLIESLQ